MKKYSEEHQWIDVNEDGSATVGITKYAADELGEITFIELPTVGQALKAKEQLCVVESVKAASDVFMPASGTITEVNTVLDRDPSALNNDPEGIGWICRIDKADPADLAALMDEAAYQAFCKVGE
ncbi:MAG: glycine cleavage system protein GcvH [Victivallales bacterium]|nr:glycine cleavage system protein GcvH [Victivallales bacterium]